MPVPEHRFLWSSWNVFLIFLVANNGYLITLASGQSCEDNVVAPSCQLSVVLEVGGCRDEFTANICPCQDVEPCGGNDCPNEPVTTTGATATATTTATATATATTQETTQPTASTATTTTPRPADQKDQGRNITSCQDLYDKGARTSQVYRLYPAQDGDGFNAFCEMDDRTGTGWTVILRRDPNDPDVNFSRLYREYIEGFGDVERSHWLGNDRVYAMTENYVRLLVEMTDWEGNSAFAEYSRFKLEHPALFYRLRVTYSHGTAGNALAQQDMKAFSTLDKDDDRNPQRNCAREYQGAFWYSYCTLGFAVKANPTGPYRMCPGTDCHRQPGIYWTTWIDEPYSIRSIVMKMA